MAAKSDLEPIGNAIDKLARAARPVGVRSTRLERQKRLLDAAAAQADANPAIAFQHSLLCQTSLPVKQPKPGVTRWERRNGMVHLEITAGRVFTTTGEFVDVGLPWGPKARLLTLFLATQAKLNNSATFAVDRSFSAFVRRMGLDPTGKHLQTVKDQFIRLLAAELRLGMIEGNQAVTLQTHFVEMLATNSLTTAANGRIVWPDQITLSGPFWASLQTHAVPLSEKSLAALSYSCLALDLYAFLAQRLYRMRPGSTYTVYWPVLADQFAANYSRPRNFRPDLRTALRMVHSQYPAARVEIDDHGLVLRESPPPVSSLAIAG